MTALALDIRIEQRTRRTIGFTTWLIRLSKFSFSKWMANKLIRSIDELSELINEEIYSINDLSKDDADKLYQASQVSIRLMIKYNELLKESEYLNNSELEQVMDKCLNSFYIMEAKSKKIAKSGTFKGTDSNIKSAFSEKSMNSISSHLTK